MFVINKMFVILSFVEYPQNHKMKKYCIYFEQELK
jgi:hypothetical protein